MMERGTVHREAPVPGAVGVAAARANGSVLAVPSDRLALILLCAILLLAVGLRLWALDRAPLWWDEGNNAYFAHRTLADVVHMSRATRDADPPAHRLALGLWLRLVGSSPLTLRLFSVLFGVATVALVYAWMRWLVGSVAGLGAALLLALSPMAIYYSREAKSYAFVAFFGLLAVYLWARYLDASERPRPWLWAIYVVSSALALGAHYYAALLIAAQGVYLVASLVASRDKRAAGRRLLPWLAAQVGVAALILPWVALTGRASLQGAQSLSRSEDALGLLSYPAEVASDLSAGPHGPPLVAIGAALILAFTVAWALWSVRQRVGLVAAVALVPIGLGYLAQWVVPFFDARFFFYTTPALYALAALGIVRMGRAGYLLGAVLVALWLVAAPEAFARSAPDEDLRPIADVLARSARPEDVIVVSYIWQQGALEAYAPEVESSYRLGWFDEGTVEAQMEALASGHARVWLVTYKSPMQHPDNLAGWWLEGNAARAEVADAGANDLALYLMPGGEDPFEEVGRIGDGIVLAHAGLPPQAAAGDPFAIALRWTVVVPPGGRYAVFVHLADADLQPDTQSDSEPVNGLVSFSQLQAGDEVIDRRALTPPVDLAPGRYRVLVGLYSLDSGERMPVTQGPASDEGALVLGELEIVPPQAR